MRQTSVIVALVCFVGTTVAQAATWAQCGGVGWSGATACVSGSVCTKQNDYYSQCVPGAAASSAAPPPPPPATTVAQPTGAPPTSTASSPAPTGSQLRTVNDPVFHFYLQNHDGQPVLGPEASSGYFTIGAGTIELSGQTPLFLNANTTASTSFKPLTLASTATTTNWALEGDTIITTNPRELNFLACSTSDPNFYSLFLQTGNDQPAGASCSMQTLHLPCLC